MTSRFCLLAFALFVIFVGAGTMVEMIVGGQNYWALMLGKHHYQHGQTIHEYALGLRPTRALKPNPDSDINHVHPQSYESESE